MDCVRFAGRIAAQFARVSLMSRCTPRSVSLFLLTALLALGGCSFSEEYDPLPTPGTDINSTSVSGLSAGAYMAGQFQMAHSRIVLGAGLIAGGPYGCGQSQFTEKMAGPGVAFINMGKAINGCMKNSLKLAGIPNVPRLVEMARDLANRDEIDPLPQVWTDGVYLYSANADQTVVGAIVSAARDFYEGIGVPHDKIKYLHHQSGGHAFITKTHGLSCGESGAPFLNACDYDQAGAVLQHIRGELKPRRTANEERFLTFDQRPFTKDIDDHNMASSGGVYIPEQCAAGTSCGVHVVFHGCGQADPKVMAEVMRKSGYVDWADANDLVVLFPRVAVSAANPAACWDWWGYTGSQYLTKSAPQIRAVRTMLDHMAKRS